MPDITMCSTDSCLKKETCYRYMATADRMWQSFSDFTDVCVTNKSYDMYIKYSKENKKHE